MNYDKKSQIFSQRLGWSKEQKELEQKLLADHLKQEFAWRHKIV